MADSCGMRLLLALATGFTVAVLGAVAAPPGDRAFAAGPAAHDVRIDLEREAVTFRLARPSSRVAVRLGDGTRLPCSVTETRAACPLRGRLGSLERLAIVASRA